jgi:hypothetical protein
MATTNATAPEQLPERHPQSNYPNDTPVATTKTTAPEQLPKRHPQSNYPNDTPIATTKTTAPEQIPERHPQSNYPNDTPIATTKTTAPEQLPEGHPHVDYKTTPPLTYTPTTAPPKWMSTSTVTMTSCPAIGVQDIDVINAIIGSEDVCSSEDNDEEHSDVENAVPGCIFELTSSLRKKA